MQEWTLIGTASLPGTAESLSLYRSGDDFVIRLSGSGTELMSTRRHGSEDALGRLPFTQIANQRDATVLIGGLGMGFTVAAALESAGPNARIIVAELLPEVVDWNHGPLGQKSGRPLDDPRTTLHLGDVSELLKQATGRYDIIALDTDNGPEGLVAGKNDWLYSASGIAATMRALQPDGVIAYWSATSDPAFIKRLRRAGAKVFEKRVHAHGTKGTRHTIWLASPTGEYRNQELRRGLQDARRK